jgi:hypothetical protein
MDGGNNNAHGFPFSAYLRISLQSRKPLSGVGYHTVIPTKIAVKKVARLEYNAGKGTGEGSVIV